MHRLQYFSWRREWPAAAAAALLLAVYGISMPPGAVFEDTGMIAAVCYNFGVLHPSGYPLYTLLCAPFARLADILPLNPAQATAVFSALAAAGACVFFYEIARRFGAGATAAAGMAAMLGLGAQFWAQAVIPEVYALNALLVAATLAALLRVIRHPSRRRVLWLFLLGGLGLANHWPLYALNAPAFILFFAAARPWRKIPPRDWAAGAGLAVLGLAPYLYLLLRAQWGAPLSIVAPPLEWRETLAYIARAPYAKLPAAPQEWTQCAAGAWWGARLLAAEYSYAGVAAAAGALVFLRRRPPLWSAAVLAGIASAAPVLGWILCGDVEGATARTIFAAYPLPAMIFLMIFAAEGLKLLPQKRRAAAALILAFAAGALNWQQNNRNEDDLAEEYAAAILDSLPQNAVLVLDGDLLFPVFYRLHALADRPDITPAKSVEELQEYAGRRRFYTTHTFHPPKNAPVGDWGILQEWQARDKTPPPPPLLNLYRRLLRQYGDFDSHARQWSKIAVRRGIFDAARALTAAAHNRPPDAEMENLRAALAQTPEGLFGELTARIGGKAGAISTNEIRDTLSALRHAGNFLPEWRAQILHREGVLELLAGRRENARQKLEAAVAEDAAADNPALIDLLHLLAAENAWAEYQKLRRRYWMAQNPALDAPDKKCAAALSAPCREN